MFRRVVEVIDGDTFRVYPRWRWNNKEGEVVRPRGYDAPEKGEPGYYEAKAKLEKLILGKNVDLRNPVGVTYGRLLCDVYINGKNLADYFPEYET